MQPGGVVEILNRVNNAWDRMVYESVVCVCVSVASGTMRHDSVCTECAGAERASMLFDVPFRSGMVCCLWCAR